MDLLYIIVSSVISSLTVLIISSYRRKKNMIGFDPVQEIHKYLRNSASFHSVIPEPPNGYSTKSLLQAQYDLAEFCIRQILTYRNGSPLKYDGVVIKLELLNRKHIDWLNSCGFYWHGGKLFSNNMFKHEYVLFDNYHFQNPFTVDLESGYVSLENSGSFMNFKIVYTPDDFLTYISNVTFCRNSWGRS